MAAPIKGTKLSDLNINGTNGADKLQGKDGNDFLFGGQGNDDIDGGKGIDTAVYTGNYSDYSISFKGTGNNKVTVTDSVASRDGTDGLKNVEFLKFNDALVDLQSNVTHFSDHTLDASSYQGAGDPHPGEMWFNFPGTGNLPTHYNIAVANDYDVELGLKIHHRGGADILPASVDADGTAHYNVPAGQDPHPHSGDRAAWNFDFSVNTGLDGNTQTLDAFEFKIIIADNDGNSQTFDLQHLGPGNTPWLNTPPTGGFADEDGTDAQLSQNSVNVGFGFLSSVFGPDHETAGEQYDIQLQAFSGNTLIASVHDVVVVV